MSELLGTSVKLYKNTVLSANLVVGRMAFSQSRNPYQQRPDAVTYLRNQGEETVYAVEGMLAMVASQDVNDFRNGEIVNCDPANLTRITFTYPGDSSFVLQKENQTWTINGTLADSANTHNYLQSLRNFTSRDFESLSETEDHVAPAYEVNIEGNNMENIIVKAYPAGDDLFHFISSMNNETAFKPDLSRLEQLFRGKSWFL